MLSSYLSYQQDQRNQNLPTSVAYPRNYQNLNQYYSMFYGLSGKIHIRKYFILKKYCLCCYFCIPSKCSTSNPNQIKLGHTRLTLMQRNFLGLKYFFKTIISMPFIKSYMCFILSAFESSNTTTISPYYFYINYKLFQPHPEHNQTIIFVFYFIYEEFALHFLWGGHLSNHSFYRDTLHIALSYYLYNTYQMVHYVIYNTRTQHAVVISYQKQFQMVFFLFFINGHQSSFDSFIVISFNFFFQIFPRINFQTLGNQIGSILHIFLMAYFLQHIECMLDVRKLQQIVQVSCDHIDCTLMVSFTNKYYFHFYPSQSLEIITIFKYFLKINKMSSMFNSKSDYDRGINTFSPQGRIFQVQYAIEAIKLGSSAVGIKVEEGVVLAVQRRLNSTLIVPESIEKIFQVDEHICCAASGVITDARTLIDHARVQALNHRFTYLEPITVKALTQTISDLALNFGEGDPSSKKKPMSRPYGVALLIAGVDENGPSIYQTDPSGTMIEYKAKGIGAADEGIQSILTQKYNPKMPLIDAQKLALLSLKETMQEKITKNNIEMMVISKATKKVQRKSAQEIKAILQTLK